MFSGISHKAWKSVRTMLLFLVVIPILAVLLAVIFAALAPSAQ